MEIGIKNQIFLEKNWSWHPKFRLIDLILAMTVFFASIKLTLHKSQVHSYSVIAVMSLQFTHIPSFAYIGGLWKSRADCSTVGLYCVTILLQQICKGSLYITVASVLPHVMGVSWNFSRGGKRRHCAYPFSGCERCNANGPSQNALLFLHHQKNSPRKHALHSHYFEIVFRSCCIRVCEKVVLFVILYSFAELRYHPISLLLWTAGNCNIRNLWGNNWVWTGLELSVTAFVVLTLVCTGWTSLLKI